MGPQGPADSLQALSRCLNAAGEKGTGQSRRVLRLNFLHANAIWKQINFISPYARSCTLIRGWTHSPTQASLTVVPAMGLTGDSRPETLRGWGSCVGWEGPSGVLVTISTGHQASHLLVSTQAMSTAASCSGRYNPIPSLDGETEDGVGEASVWPVVKGRAGFQPKGCPKASSPQKYHSPLD